VRRCGKGLRGWESAILRAEGADGATGRHVILGLVTLLD